MKTTTRKTIKFALAFVLTCAAAAAVLTLAACPVTYTVPVALVVAAVVADLT